MQKNTQKENLPTNETFPEMIISDVLPGVPGGGTRVQDLLRKPWPEEQTYWKHLYGGGCEDLFFICKPVDSPKFFNMVKEAALINDYPLSDIGFYLQPIEYARACHLEFNFYYHPDNSEEVDRVRRVKRQAEKALLDQGAFFTRPYGEIARTVYERAASYTEVLKQVKGIFDPNNIMNPGNLCF